MDLAKLLWGLGFSGCLIAGGCGGDDDDDDGNGTAGSAGMSSGGSGGSGTMMNVECDPADDGVCENDSDCPKVESGAARAAAQDCGQDCLGDADPETCSVECIVMAEDMTPECAGCYAATVKCSIDNCLAECATAPTSQACADCQVDSGCRAAFDDCSGLPPAE